MEHAYHKQKVKKENLGQSWSLL